MQRVPLRGTQVALDLIRALAIASVPLAWWFDALTVVQLIVVALVGELRQRAVRRGEPDLPAGDVPAAQLQAPTASTPAPMPPPSSAGRPWAGSR